MLANHWTVRVILAIFYHLLRTLWNFKERIFNPEVGVGSRSYDIAFRYNMDPVCLQSSLNHFCLKFKRAVPATAILEENVYLFCIEAKEVSFIVVEPGKEIWRSKYGSFYKMAQNEYARQVITVPLEDFLDVCSNLSDPGSKLNFIDFSLRSGSTLLIQMFEETGQCMTFAEPDEFVLDPSRFKPEITFEEKVQLFRAIGRYVARGINNNEEYKWYFAKISASETMQHYDAIKEALPQSKHIYLYRDYEGFCKSFISAMNNLPLTQAASALMRTCPFLFEAGVQDYIRRANSGGIVDDSTLKKLMPVWLKSRASHAHCGTGFYQRCASMDFFLNKRRIQAIKYEDLVENSKENMKRIFDYFGLPSDLVGKALTAMKRDSQRNSTLSRKNIRQRVKKLDEGLKALADEFSSAFSVPKMDEDQRHENTLTTPASTHKSKAINGH